MEEDASNFSSLIYEMVTMEDDLFDISSPSFVDSCEYEVFPEDLNHVDIQGFHWYKSFHREKHRLDRLKEANFSLSDFKMKMENRTESLEANYFSFKYSSRTDFCTFSSNFLRHSILCTGEDKVVYTFGNTIYIFNPILNASYEVFNSSILADRFSLISTIDGNDNVVILGGICGELVTVTSEERHSIHQYDIKPISSLNIHPTENTVLICNSSNNVSIFDLNRSYNYQAISHKSSISCCRFHPTERLCLSIGKSNTVQILDSRQPSITPISAPIDSEPISCALSENLAVTSHMDCKSHMWDLRYFTHPLHSFCSLLSTVRDCQFSCDGQYLALAESDDFVSIYSSTSPYIEQKVDFIGETAGISFSPNSNALYIGIGGDVSFSGILEFERINYHESFLENFI